MDEQVDEEVPVGLGCALETFGEEEAIDGLISSLEAGETNGTALERSLEQFTTIIDYYQEQPHLLDRVIPKFFKTLLETGVNTELPHVTRCQCFKFMYHLTKTRGYKHILRLLPHEVSDLPLALNLLKQQNPTDNATWEVRYILFVWLSVIGLIPFEMSRFDGSSRDEPIARQLVDVSLQYLSATDKVRDAAAYFLSHFITRPDLVTLHLPQVLDTCMQRLADECSKQTPSVSTILGFLSAVAMVFKHGKRVELEKHAEMIYSSVKNFHLENNKHMLIRKLVCKLYTRVCLVHLKTKSASWHYKKGARSLLTTLANDSEAVAVENCSNDGMLAATGDNDPSSTEDDDFEVKEDVESVLNDMLMTFIKDGDTFVRWSAAKGIGRVTARLPLHLANDIIDTILGYFSPLESEHTWHGCCLALAELGRRGLFLPTRLAEVIEVMKRSFQFDEQRGYSSVGSNVRDAACYLAWSLPRTFDKAVLADHVAEIASSLILVVLFDREVNCRRAASAAFQENVGRHGKLPDGIEILTLADYRAVGNRRNCYTYLAVEIAKFGAYCRPIIDHLVEKRVVHWDSSVRLLAAEALGLITPLEVQYMHEVVLPIVSAQMTRSELNFRHGSILAVGSVLHALHFAGFPHNQLSPLVRTAITELIPVLQSKNFLKGIGGTTLRPSVCILIGKVSQTGFFSEAPLAVRCRDFLLECALSSDLNLTEEVQTAACQALSPFYQACRHVDTELHQTLLTSILTVAKSSTPDQRAGAAMVAGCLPESFYTEQSALEISKHLKDAIQFSISNPALARSRVCSLDSISRIFVILAANDGLGVSFCENTFEALLVGLQDYSNDERGDIGQSVRNKSIQCLEKCVCASSVDQRRNFPSVTVQKCMCQLMNQAGSRLNNVRESAFIALRRMHNADVLDAFPEGQRLKMLIEPFSKGRGLELGALRYSSSEMFNHLYHFLGLETYGYDVLLGLTTCLGGLTETLSNDALQALLSYGHEISQDPEKCDRLLTNYLAVLRNNVTDDRIIRPYLKSTTLLLQAGFFDTVAQQNSKFGDDLISMLKPLSKTTMYQKLVLLANLYAAMLISQNETVTRACLKNLLFFLGHQYPKLRKHTADQLFEAILICPELLSDLPDERQVEVNELLTEFDWTEIDLPSARAKRNEMCLLFNIEPPKKIKANGAQTG